MYMFWEFFTFELKFRLKSISTYIYFVLWFTLNFMFVTAQDFGPIGNGKVLLNGPYASATYFTLLDVFGIIVIASIFGTSILRDFQRDTYQLLFTKPISKFAYLGGRWAGSLVTTVFAFSGLLFGEMAGALAPWADQSRLASGHLWWYVQPFLSIVVVQIFFLGSLFFCVAALTRKIFIVYLQGVVLFMAYLIGITIVSTTRSLEHYWSGLLDPVGLMLMDSVTRYWTVAEKNSLLMSWTGVFLQNRLLWLAIGCAALLTVWVRFPMSVEALTARASSKRAIRARQDEDDEIRPVRSWVSAVLPKVTQVFGPGATWAQLVSLTKLRVNNIVREIPFWAIVGLLIVFAINNGYFAGRMAGRNVWPVTYLMLQSVEGSATLFFFIVATLYAGELVWRERDTRFSGIHDVLPMPESVDWASKFLALGFVEIILLTLTGICGVAMQIIGGYYRFEPIQYFQELFLISFPQMMTFVLFALFIQTIVSNKFIGHGIAIGFFISQPILFRYGFENTLFLIGATPAYTYSDMNGYGHFVPALAWAIVYWLAIMSCLGVLSIAFARRGSDDSTGARLRLAGRRLPRLVPALLVFFLIAAGSGTWYYWNAHVRNKFETAKMRRVAQADYERQFKQYEKLPQPKITRVDAEIDIYPERRSFSGTGHFLLENKTGQPIRKIHITNQQRSVTEVEFDRAFQKDYGTSLTLYSIYNLVTPLLPGEKMKMKFHVGYTTHGFKDGNERPEMAFNGTFFDSGYFPFIGYDTNVELDDPLRRKEEHLGELQELAPRGDPFYEKVNLFSSDSDWINFHTVVSTSSNQIAVAPGYLKKQWKQGSRNYFEYDMGGVKTADFYSYLSGHYAIKRDKWKNVNLEIYYTPGHEFDLDDMMASSKAGLEYYEKNFSPYQFQQYRIMEFPRYRSFAQSFPNTVPYSEAIGFIGRMKDEDDIDFTYFVTAHELAHQWWGHQLIGGRVQGSNMMSETLAEYSALKVMEKKYGPDNMHKFLKHELDTYLRGRAGEIRREPPLALVQRESYVWYQKGGQVMYTLADYIGEDKVNTALRTFLDQYRYANSTDDRSGPYPDTRQFVAALREQTPADMQYLITDMFESIVLYDNKAVTATVAETPDKKFKVALTVQARKARADGNGMETPMPLNDYVDIGIFTGKKDHEKPLLLKKVKVTQGKNTFELIVDKMPTRAGIDPYNKLIDRIADDNMIDVTTK